MTNSVIANPNLQSLFGGSLSPAVTEVLTVPDIGAQIQAGLCNDIADVHAGEVTVVGELVDDSGSIRFKSNAPLVREGHNAIIDSLIDAKLGESVLMACRYLNGNQLFPFVSLKDAIPMNEQNYNPMGSTPLFDQTAVFLGTVLKQASDFADAGTPCRSVTAIITDGNDEYSKTHTKPEDIKPLIEEMLATEMHIILAMGIDDGTTNFRDIFGRMGIPADWILTPKNTHSEIRKAFAMVSRVSVRASRAAGGAAFSKVAAGGFGTP